MTGLIYMLMFQAIGTHWQSFKLKFCEIKESMVYSYKILVQILANYIFEHILPIYPNTLSIGNNIIQRNLKISILETVGLIPSIKNYIDQCM